ncbi:hypothetical protein PHYBLDRAFT_151314 [Phycomyces blakesleeanus NRRL 1555(-)]|uniref:Uncharacterized protein n=1 Tax=Phycomyces blakesleeanus (strain ATCC 8743b / DSM 1359 / FGSC 10004 / NBRC 33097 / NRRL 1555) TaxID=763407 RepID=A0A167KCU9_PHYB8|nr:hypothetical protein PHYBLDRAFT_151314 [Phycomyces blakesleeanus NRRL 1555(-)]OAD67785.1 hypothetical protein PHYBLDRAFT_151314 [Phycomyces blakesleeanus NRRL 1555(-)]|eukprot:XP_018285825.1 hypothetical protein PHYBLDRAFT_151314 [Phycomyces blakesleeanus NRRL 1555(-)]
MATFNIAANYNNHIIPDYIESVDSFDLSSEDEFTNYHEKNTVFVGKPLENPLKPAQKRITTTKSIKIGYSASIYKHTMTDGTACIKYNWQHPNHDPFKIEEISLSRLPDELKQ